MIGAARRWRPAAALIGMLAVACLPVADNSGGMGLPQQNANETFPGRRGPVAGRFVVADNGCFLLRTADDLQLIVWPADATHGGAEAILGDGTRLTDGDRIQGSGAVLAVQQLPHWPEGYWASTVGFCTPDAGDVVVFDTVAPEE